MDGFAQAFGVTFGIIFGSVSAIFASAAMILVVAAVVNFFKPKNKDVLHAMVPDNVKTFRRE